MRLILFFILFSNCLFLSAYNSNDTITISSKQLNIKKLKTGNHNYVVFFKDSLTAPARNISLFKINIQAKKFENKKAIVIHQQWEKDTTTHTASTILDANDLSTLNHEYFWKGLKYSASFNFVTREINYTKAIEDSIKAKHKEDFEKSFSKYNLNWHVDFSIFPLLPFSENRVFKINLYDPGFGEPSEEYYTVIGSDTLINHAGKNIKCWILEFKIPNTYGGGYKRFWISKKERELLKEEDFFNGHFYRYKIKVTV